MMGFIKFAIISVLIIFIGQQLMTYLQTQFVDMDLYTTTLEDSKKMYEEMADTLKQPFPVQHLDRSTETPKQLSSLPSPTVDKEQTSAPGTTPLSQIVPNEPKIDDDMIKELTEHMNKLSS